MMRSTEIVGAIREDQKNIFALLDALRRDNSIMEIIGKSMANSDRSFAEKSLGQSLLERVEFNNNLSDRILEYYGIVGEP